MEERKLKEQIKDFWKEEGDKIKIGVKCLSVGLLVGFVKGVLTESKMQSNAICDLVDKISNETNNGN